MPSQVLAPHRRPKVSVSVITYNQERYIAQALDSVLAQVTDFEVEIVVGEDCSTDATRDICRGYRDRYPDRIRLLERPRNMGIVANYLSTFLECRGEYVALLEGDDFWTDPTKLSKQVAFLSANPDYAICCHDIQIADEAGLLSGRVIGSLPDTTGPADLCLEDYIATCACMVRGGLVTAFPRWIYALPACDWAVDILHAERGKIKYLDEAMGAYRRHAASAWSGLSPVDQHLMAIKVGLELDRGFGFRYHRELSSFVERNRIAYMMAREAASGAARTALDGRISALEARLADRPADPPAAAPTAPTLAVPAEPAMRPETRLGRLVQRLRRRGRIPSAPVAPSVDPEGGPLDLLVLDDLYPHRHSAFRKAEYEAYLASFPRSQVYSTGEAFRAVDDTRPVAAAIEEHEREKPDLRGRVRPHDALIAQPALSAALGYTVFLNNAWQSVALFEARRIPFVFTLYPGGGFCLDNDTSDAKLRRVLGSPMFRKVVVTQSVTRDYLLAKRLCAADRIAFIYGGIAAEVNLRPLREGRPRFGFGKATLDICFTAHKYTPKGVDKGYDIFIDVARRLAADGAECRFHVVGGFTADDVPIDGLEGKITFYGVRSQAWLRSFYEDKDLILLCNVPSVLAPGAFDGFPAGCGLEAMLNEVALFCTDPLKLNCKLEDGQDLLIVPHDVDAIVGTLRAYRGLPAPLRVLGRSGRRAAERVFGSDAQIAPRIALLRQEIAKARHGEAGR